MKEPLDKRDDPIEMFHEQRYKRSRRSTENRALAGNHNVNSTLTTLPMTRILVLAVS